MPNDSQPRILDISFATIIKLGVAVAVFYLLYQVINVLALIFVAIILSTALDPSVDWLQKKHIPRSLALVCIYLVLFLVVSFILIVMVPPVIEELTNLARSLPIYYSRFLENFSDTSTPGAEQWTLALQQGLQSLGNGLADATSSVLNALFSLFGGIAQFAVVLVMAFYLVVQENGLVRFVRSVIPTKKQAYWIKFIERIKDKLGSWLRGQLLLMLIIGLMTYVSLVVLKVFGVIGIEYILVLSLWAGLTELIPYIGPILGAIPAVLLALAISPLQAVIIIALYIIIQQLENQIIVPQVMKRAVGLNPIISIASVLVGAELGGAVGAIIAIPVATALAVLFSDIIEEHMTTEFALESKDNTK